MMDTTSIRRAGALLDLARQHLPQEVESPGQFDDWNVIGPALVGLGTTTLEAIYQLPPPRHRVQAEVLFRSLSEYCITFAWLAAEPESDVQRERLASFVRDEWLERGKAENRIAKSLVEHPTEHYRRLMDEGRLPTNLLNDETRAVVAKWKTDDSVAPLPGLLDRAFAADEYWLDRLPFLARSPFAVQYVLVFGHFSFVAHASVTAVDRFVTGQGGRLRAGEPEGLGDSLGPYGNACSTVAIMLFIASATFGWPNPSEVNAAAATGVPTDQDSVE